MQPAQPRRTWVEFTTKAPSPSPSPSGDGDGLRVASVARVVGVARIDRYVVRAVVPVRGRGPEVPLQPGQALWRVEGGQAPGPSHEGETLYRGMVEPLHYTTAGERRELSARSRGEVAAGEATRAVLIPITKSAAWWALAPDERQPHFRLAGQAHGGIGLRYAERIHRRLYHARAFGEAPDFLTYFEFEAALEPDFRALLAELRDERTNPEWAFVTEECEVWLDKCQVGVSDTKIGVSDTPT